MVSAADAFDLSLHPVSSTLIPPPGSTSCIHHVVLDHRYRQLPSGALWTGFEKSTPRRVVHLATIRPRTGATIAWAGGVLVADFLKMNDVGMSLIR